MHVVKAMALRYISVSLRSHPKQGGLGLEAAFIWANFSSVITKEPEKNSDMSICTCTSFLLLNEAQAWGRSGLRPWFVICYMSVGVAAGRGTPASPALGFAFWWHKRPRVSMQSRVEAPQTNGWKCFCSSELHIAAARQTLVQEGANARSETGLQGDDLYL